MAETLSGTPTITVVTVVFNGARDIARTIESTLSQDHPALEYMIVDGQSNDGTQAIVASYGSAIDIFVSEPDLGIYDAMNKAIARARGEYILFMNCGDAFASDDALSCAARAAISGRERIIFGAWDRVDGRGHHTLCRPALEAGFFNHQSVLYSRSFHQRHGGYATVKGFTTADYLFFMTLLASGDVECVRIDKTIAVIDVSGVSAGSHTLSQKFAIDYLLGRTSRARLLAVLALHPAYYAVKCLLRRLR